VDEATPAITDTGRPVVRFRIAAGANFIDDSTGDWHEGETVFMSCQCGDQQAEDVASPLSTGTQVAVTGRIRHRVVHADDGSERVAFEIDADKIVPLPR